MRDGECVKTGADVYLHSHHALVHGDLFSVGNVWILHHTGEDFWIHGPENGTKYNLRVGVIGNYLDLKSAKVLVMNKFVCSPFNYDGWDLCD